MQRTACNSSIFCEVLLRKISEMFSACSRAIFTPEAMRSMNLVSTCSTLTQMRNLVSRTQILKWCFVVSLRALERDLFLLTSDDDDDDDDDVGTNTSLIFIYISTFLGWGRG